MSDLEIIEDLYPELRFWFIDVPSPHYHGHIEGTDVYINCNQSNDDWIKTSPHEVVHYSYDYCNLSNARSVKTMRSEKWAVCESQRVFRKLFGKHE